MIVIQHLFHGDRSALLQKPYKVEITVAKDQCHAIYSAGIALLELQVSESLLHRNTA